MDSNENDIKKQIERDRFKFEIENINNKIENLEKRYADKKWHILTYFTIIPVLVAALAIVFGLNLNNEKNQIRDFQKDLRDEVKRELGKIDEPAKIAILTTDKNNLFNQTIQPKIYKDKDGYDVMEIEYILVNKGGSPSGNIWTKIYAGKGLDIGTISSDEPKYSSESIIPPEKNKPNNIPANLSLVYTITLTLNSSSKIKKGTYPVLVKWYYGKDKVEQVPFFVKILHDIG